MQDAQLKPPNPAPPFRFSRVRVTVVHLYWATRFGEKTWLPLCWDIQRLWKESFRLAGPKKKDLTIVILVWNCYGTHFCSLDLRDFHVSSDLWGGALSLHVQRRSMAVLTQWCGMWCDAESFQGPGDTFRERVMSEVMPWCRGNYRSSFPKILVDQLLSHLYLIPSWPWSTCNIYSCLCRNSEFKSPMNNEHPWTSARL